MKVILFTDRDDTPISFRGMTSIFRDRLDVNDPFFFKEIKSILK